MCARIVRTSHNLSPRKRGFYCTDFLRALAIDQILRGELLPLGLAGDVFECSDEKLRKLCELTAGTERPLGVKLAGRWLASVPRLLDDLEQGTLDRRRRGREVRLRAEERARKYQGWARPQEPLVEIPAQKA
jgi:hypothetical protein